MHPKRSISARYERLPLFVISLVLATMATGWFALNTTEQQVIGAVAVLTLLGMLAWALRRLKLDWERTAEGEALLDATIRSIGDAVITTDSDCRVRMMNQMAERITGWTEEQARGHRLNEILMLMERESGEFLTNSFHRVLNARTTVQLPRDTVLHGRDGMERVVACTGTPIRNAAGSCLGAVLVLRDVTEEALSQSALRASQVLFDQITQNVSDIITIHELDGRRIFISPQAAAMVPSVHLPNIDAFANIVDEDREAAKAAFQSVVMTGRPVRAEYRWISETGTHSVIESVATLIHNVNGKAEKVLVVSRDMTQRRTAERRLQAEVEFTESLLKGLPGIFFVCDSQLQLIRWNRNFEVVTGIASAEMAEADLRTIFVAFERESISERILRCFGDGKVDGEIHVRHRQGQLSAYFLTGLRIDTHEGPAMLGIGIDISARKAAEQSLLATSGRLERQNSALAEQARNPALRGEDLDAAYREITRTAARTLGVSRASIWFYNNERESLRCADLYDLPAGKHTAGLELCRADCPNYFEALATGRVIPAHYARNDPRTRDFAENYLKPLGITSMLDAPIRSEGRMVGVICHEHTGSPREWTLDEQNFAGSMADLVCLSLEVSQRRQAERALRETMDQLEVKVAERTSELSRANDRLQELDRLKSEFLATMSHELRTPLNSIIGFTGILRQEIPGPLNDEQKKQLGMVNFSAKHLLSVINDLLDLSRIESGRMEVHREVFRIADVVNEVVDSLRPLAAQKKLHLDTMLSEPDATIETDRKKAFQILLNLANNAVKFTETGGVRIWVQCGDEEVQFEVEDTGIGIRPEQMGNLFQAFRQIDGSSRRVYEGTGLGLYLCKKLLTLLGGAIDVRSEFGSGSCFTFTLPRQTRVQP